MSEQIENPKAAVPGFWTNFVSAYSDAKQRCPVLTSDPNGGDFRKGYLRYLIFRDNKAFLQCGPVLPTSLIHEVETFEVPAKVAEKAIQAAMDVVNNWAEWSGAGS